MDNLEENKEKEEVKIKKEEAKESKEKLSKKILNFYDQNYKKLMVIPLLMLLFSFAVIGFQIAKTGTFINKDVSLKGGVTLTITTQKTLDIEDLEKFLASKFTDNDISVRSIKRGNTQIAVLITSDIEGTNPEELDSFIKTIESYLGYQLDEDAYSTEIIGSSLGTSFFKEAFIALISAFVLMSIVIFIYFRIFVPSLAVILSVFFDIIVTLAIVNLIGLKISTGGIAAFLMLIGYSVDTDILLTTRVLKRKEGTVLERTVSSIKTGMTMSITAIIAALMGWIFVQAAMIKEILLIIIIGLLVDMISTWIQNVGILRYYLERKDKDKAKEQNRGQGI